MNRYTNGKPLFSLAMRVVAGYAVFSILWIVLSDQLVLAFLPHPAPVVHLQTLKGLLFVFLSAVLMYWLIARDQQACSLAQEQIRKLSMAVEQSANSVVITNLDGFIEYVNPAFCEITGYAAEEAVGRHTRMLKSGETPAEVYQKLWSDLLAGHDWHGEFHNRKKNGNSYWCIESISPIKTPEGRITHFVAVAEDVSERSYAAATIKHLAYYDPLTHLPNRTLFRDRLVHAVASARFDGEGVALLHLDVDRFQSVNDSLGHEAGNRLLQETALRLESCLGHEDTLARLGDDEFAAILAHAHSERTLTVAEHILETLRAPFSMEGHEIFLTASIGVSLFPGDGNDPDTLIKNAGVALQRAKERGRDNFQFFTADMNTLMLERLKLEADLHHALEREEFLLHYQPQVDLETGEIGGMEALIRWQSQNNGLIPPAEFIPLAEETGLIVPIGDWVIRAACAQLKAWHDAGLPKLPVAINLSARQFRQKDLAQRIAAILAETGLEARWLELEITETTVMHHSEESIVTLRALHGMGVRISVDDFGTGYSSLSYLKRFPIQMLKVDQSFVRDITTDPDDAAIVAAVASLAHNLGLKVIAEGVETPEQLMLLRALRCNSFQGFHFSRPLPAAEFEAILRDGKHLPM